MADAAAAESKIEDDVKAVADDLRTKIEAAALAKDATLADDYAELARLTTNLHAAVQARNACKERIKQKEGAEIRDARVVQEFASLTPAQRQQFMVRGGR